MSEAPGWYPDPTGKNQQRFWDGDAWTEYYQPLPPPQPQLHNEATATEDYPYLADAATHTWAPPGATTQWGHPLGMRNDDEERSTRVYRSGTAGNGNRGGLIAVILASVVVVGLLITGGIMAFQEPNSAESAEEPRADASDGQFGDVVDDVVGVGQSITGDVPADGEWVALITISDGGAYVFDARAAGSGDLQMAVRNEQGTLAYNDDRGMLLRADASRLDPLIVYRLAPGEYEVVLSEYHDDAAAFELAVGEITEQIDLDTGRDVTLEPGEYYMAVLDVHQDTDVTIDVNGLNNADPTLTVRSLDRDAAWSNDDRDHGDQDPTLEDLTLDRGSYAVILAEARAAPLSAHVQITSS